MMFDSEFSNYITLTNTKTNESIRLDQRKVRIRENQNGLMALSYLAPVFDIIDVEDFFDGFLTSEKLSMDISDTGEFTVAFRGIIEGKGKKLPQNLDHRIILLQGPSNWDSRMNVQLTGFSKFKLRNGMSH